MKKSNLQFYCAASVLLLIIGASILAPLLVTHNPFEPDMANRLQGSCFMIAIAGIFGPSIKSLVLTLVITS